MSENLERKYRGKQGERGEQGAQGEQGMGQGTRRAVVFLFVFALALGGINLLFTAHAVNTSQRRWCATLTLLSARAVPKPADAAANPSRKTPTSSTPTSSTCGTASAAAETTKRAPGRQESHLPGRGPLTAPAARGVTSAPPGSNPHVTAPGWCRSPPQGHGRIGSPPRRGSPGTRKPPAHRRGLLAFPLGLRGGARRIPPGQTGPVMPARLDVITAAALAAMFLLGAWLAIRA